MSDPVDAVLFDLDDTICVYRRPADEVLADAFERVGVDPFFTGERYHARFEEFTDAGEDIEAIREACFAAFADEAGRDPALGREIAGAYGEERDQSNVEFTEGASAALEAVADEYRLGMVTNGDPWMQSQKLTGLGVDDHFETVVHGGVDAPYKPNPEPFHVALDDLGVGPKRAVHVGNSLASDVAGAHAAGVRSAWLANGHEDPDPEPHYVIDSLADLTEPPWP